MRAHRRRAAALILVLIGADGCTKSALMQGHAMEPTLHDQQRVVLEYLGTRTPARGDIVTFRWPRDTTKVFVQRVIGLPGESLSSTDGHIVINDRPLDEPYVAPECRSHDSWPAVTLPDMDYFVMGDCRNDSSDSRVWGAVSIGLMEAKVIQ